MPLISRNSNLFKSFESLKASLSKLRVQNAILDGEIICIDGHGISQFNQLFSRQGTPVFYAFDLLWLNHEDLRNHPLSDRKEAARVDDEGEIDGSQLRISNYDPLGTERFYVLPPQAAGSMCLRGKAKRATPFF